MTSSSPHAIIIGAGFTGCALAHDLTLRGFSVTVLERGEIASGTSGRTHGLLHSGARYCVSDQESAVECIQENILLRKIAHPCIEYNGGFFVALNESDLAYAPQFVRGAQECGIPIQEITPAQAIRFEPNLNPEVLAVYEVPDASFDPLRLALAFSATAIQNGARFFPYHEVQGLILDGKRDVTGVHAWNRSADQKLDFHADMVINATGAWAGSTLQDSGAAVEVTPTPGVMVAFDRRLTNRVINLLNLPDDGDILIPQRRMSVIGTTSYEVEDLDYIPVDDHQVEQMITAAAILVPAAAAAHVRGAYMSARPLVGASLNGRDLARTFKCFDHQEKDGIGGLVTITGGKATTCRAMAEKTADLVCAKLGVSSDCSTKDVILRSYRDFYRPVNHISSEERI